MKKHKHHDKGEELDDSPVRRNIGARSSDMNVTPLIDVLLVLLVIFIAALPMTQRGFDIQLPLESKSQPTTVDSQQVVINRTSDGQVTLNKQPIAVAELEPRLRQIFESRTDKSIFIVGDGSLRYGDIVPLIDAATAVGLRIGIITPGVRAGSRRSR